MGDEADALMDMLDTLTPLDRAERKRVRDYLRKERRQARALSRRKPE